MECAILCTYRVRSKISQEAAAVFPAVPTHSVGYLYRVHVGTPGHLPRHTFEKRRGTQRWKQVVMQAAFWARGGSLNSQRCPGPHCNSLLLLLTADRNGVLVSTMVSLRRRRSAAGAEKKRTSKKKNRH